MRRSVWTGILCVMMTIPLFSQKSISPGKIIRNVEKKLTSAKTVRIKFQETYAWKLTGEEQTLTGELLLEGKDRFRITTEDQIIVSDGDTLWTYSKPSHRVLIDRLSKSENTLLPRQILLQYTREYHARVAGEETIAGKACYVLLFRPNSGDTFMDQIRVWIDQKEWVPVKIEQTDLGGNRTTYHLREILMNPSIVRGAFQFSIPEGAEVINMMEN